MFHSVVRKAFENLATDGFNPKYSKLTEEQEKLALKYHHQLNYLGSIINNSNYSTNKLCSATDFSLRFYPPLIKKIKQKYPELEAEYAKIYNRQKAVRKTTT